MSVLLTRSIQQACGAVEMRDSIWIVESRALTALDHVAGKCLSLASVTAYGGSLQIKSPSAE